MKKLFYTEAELAQRSLPWLEMRKTCIGGSDIASILAISKKIDTPIKLWKRKTGRLAPKVVNEAMMRGAEMEEPAKLVIIDYLRENEGIEDPKMDGYFAKHPDYDFLGVSYDGVDIENKFITELKCPNFSSVFKSVLMDGIQDYYYPQVQLQLFISNAIWDINKAYFCSYYPNGTYILDMKTFREDYVDLAVLDIDYDAEFCGEMLKVAKVFWNNIQEDTWDKEEYTKTLKEFHEYYNNRA